MRWLVVLGFASLLGCPRTDETTTPEGAAEAFVLALRDAPTDPTASKRIYNLLARRDREELAVRATRATLTTGKPVTPEAMIAPNLSGVPPEALDHVDVAYPDGPEAPRAIVTIHLVAAKTSGGGPATVTLEDGEKLAKPTVRRPAKLHLVRESDLRWHVELTATR